MALAADQLSRITISGFKSIRKCDINFGKINVLIGSNGAGKSNFISAFTLLQNILSQNLQVFVAQSGMNSLFYNGRKVTEEIDFEVHFGKNSYGFVLIPTDDNRLIFRKEYLAIVDGKIDKEGTLEDYLYKDEKNNVSRVVDKNNRNSKFAKLDYKLLAYDKENDLSIVKINLHTGRHHQIRVQLANIGHSIYGDQKYGKRGKDKQIALWAYKITFEHPTKKEKISFECLPKPIGVWNLIKLVKKV